VPFYPVKIPWGCKPPPGTPAEYPGLVGAFFFNEAAGASVINAVDGKPYPITGATWRDGQLYFGTNTEIKYVAITDTNLINLPTNGGFSVVVGCTPNYPLEKDSPVVAWNGTDDLLLYPNDNGLTPNGTRIFWRDCGTNLIAASTGDANGKQIQLIFTATAGAQKVYREGVHVGSATNALSGAGPFSGLRIGGWADSATTDIFGGLVDYVLFFNRVINPAEVANPWAVVQPRTIWIPVAGGGGTSIIQRIAESANVSEADARRMWLIRAQQEAMNLPETDPRLLALRRLITEQDQVTDAGKRSIYFRRMTAETEQVSDTTTRRSILRRLVTEAQEIADSSRAIRGLKRFVASTMNIAEASWQSLVSGVTQIVQIVTTEAVNLSESAKRALGLRRVLADTEQIADTPKSARGLRRIVTASINIADTTLQKLVNTIGKLVAFAGGVMGISDTPRRTMTMRRATTEATTVSETSTRRMRLVRRVATALNVSETVSRVRGFVRSVVETGIAIVEVVGYKTAFGLLVTKVFALPGRAKVFIVAARNKIFRL
jgi:hypothetical protein